MGQTFPIAAYAEPGGAYRSGANPGSAPEAALFALLMAEAGWPFADGFGTRDAPEAQGAREANVDAGIPAFDGSGGPIDFRAVLDSGPVAEATARGIPIPKRLGPALNLGMIRPDASGGTALRRAVPPNITAALDEAGVAENVPAGPRPEKGLERGTRLMADLGIAGPEAGADAGARINRAASRPADPSTTAKPVRLSEMDLEGFGVKRLEVQVEHGHENPSGGTPPKVDEIGRATHRPIDAAPGTRGETTPMDASLPRLEHLRTPESGLHVSEAEILEEVTLAGHAGSGAGESGGGRGTSDPEWNAAVAGRSTRPGREPDVGVEAGADVPDTQPDSARPTGDFRAESRESGAIAGDRRTPAPQPPKPPDPPTLTPEPARRVWMMVGDAETEVHVLVHESNGDVSVRFDAPHAIRAHLEASAHQLVESMSREQVSLMSMTFSGPSHGNDGHSNTRHSMRTRSRGNAGPGSPEDTLTIESGLDFAESGSRIRIRV